MAKNEIDWEKGEKLFRLGQLSAAEIGRQLGCPTSTVTRHMNAAGIIQDKADEVRRRTREAIATQRNEHATQRNSEGASLREKAPVVVTDDDIDEAVNTNIALVNSHRRDLTRLRSIEEKLLGELEGEPTKLYITQFQGQIVSKAVGITVMDKASALHALTGVMAKRIEKQRQAFSIDDAPPQQSSIDEVLSAVAQARRPLVVESDDQQD